MTKPEHPPRHQYSDDYSKALCNYYGAIVVKSDIREVTVYMLACTDCYDEAIAKEKADIWNWCHQYG